MYSNLCRIQYIYVLDQRRYMSSFGPHEASDLSIFVRLWMNMKTAHRHISLNSKFFSHWTNRQLSQRLCCSTNQFRQCHNFIDFHIHIASAIFAILLFSIVMQTKIMQPDISMLVANKTSLGCHTDLCTLINLKWSRFTSAHLAHNLVFIVLMLMRYKV